MILVRLDNNVFKALRVPFRCRPIATFGHCVCKSVSTGTITRGLLVVILRCLASNRWPVLSSIRVLLVKLNTVWATVVSPAFLLANLIWCVACCNKATRQRLLSVPTRLAIVGRSTNNCVVVWAKSFLWVIVLNVWSRNRPTNNFCRRPVQ